MSEILTRDEFDSTLEVFLDTGRCSHDEWYKLLSHDAALRAEVARLTALVLPPEGTPEFQQITIEGLIVQRDRAEAEAKRLAKIIEDAPHTLQCGVLNAARPWEESRPCDCWKAALKVQP